MEKKTILITGASGMLGACLAFSWSKSEQYHIFATGRSHFFSSTIYKFKQFNLQEKTYKQLSDWVKPDVIIHCAALTNMDYCEKNQKEAMLINGESVKKLINAFPYSKLFFISTDAVFPTNVRMRKETMLTNPSSIYGKSKELGENYVKKMSKDGLIIRTTLIGKNLNPKKQSFVEWIIYSIRNRQEIILFKDVIFTPITIWHFQDELEWLIENQETSVLPNILHIAGNECVSKYDFGLNLCRKLNLDHYLIKQGQLDDMLSILPRSNDQSFNVSLYESFSRRKLPNLSDTIKLLIANFAV